MPDTLSSEFKQTPVEETDKTELKAEVTVVETDVADFLQPRKEIIYKLTDFEGPIDLLLTLIKNAKIDIEEIFISQVTHQYVEIIKDIPREEMDFDYAGQFVMLAAELIYLKSLCAVPKIEDDTYDPDDDPDVQRAALINKIKEYALLKEQSEKLKLRETVNSFSRAPVFTEKDYRVSITNFSLPKLIDAYARILANAERHGQEVIPKKVIKDRFSVHEQMEHIRELTFIHKEMDFAELIDPDFDRNDIVTTFLAVLELMKYGFIRAEQDEVFGNITIYASGDSTAPIVYKENDDGKY